MSIEPLLTEIKTALQELAAEKGRPMRLSSVLQAINFLSEFIGDSVPIKNSVADPLVNEIGSRIRSKSLQFVRQKGFPAKKDIADFVKTLDSTIIMHSQAEGHANCGV
jgi:hypothetical protein